MVPQEIREQIKQVCNETLTSLQYYLTISTSVIANDKMQAGIKEVREILAELDKNDLTIERLQYVSDKISSIGHDLINYGNLILPPGNQN